MSNSPDPFRQGPLARKALAVTAALLLAGCAALSTPKTAEDQVAQRAQERLDALLEWDLDKVIQYTTPAYRKDLNKNHYASRYLGVGNWTEARVESVSCEESACDVKVLVTYELKRPKITNTRPLQERWIEVDKQWYIYER